MNSIILDLSLILAFFLFLVLGVKNGFVKSLVLFIGSVISLFLAVYLAGIAAGFIYTHFVEPSLINHIETTLKQNNAGFNDVFANIPQFISNSAKSYGITPQSISHIINNGSAANVPKQISKLVSPVIINILRITLTAILFIISMVLVRFLAKLLRKVSRLPILKQADGFLGALFGLFKGYLIISIILCVLKIALPTMKNQPQIFSAQSINSTVLFKEMHNRNLTYSLFQKL